MEHMPPIIMFDQRQRPKGLEFPTCWSPVGCPRSKYSQRRLPRCERAECNKGTSVTDTVASMLGRVYPNSASDPAKAEIKKLLSAVSINAPGLVEEMWMDWPD